MVEKTKDKNKIGAKEILAVLIGAIIMLIPYLFVHSNPFGVFSVFAWVIWIIGGFIAAFIVRASIKYDALNGFLAAVISGVIILIVYNPVLSTSYTGANAYTIGVLTVYIIVFIGIPGIFGIVGGLIEGAWNRSRTMT
jgi:hypothetical protein